MTARRRVTLIGVGGSSASGKSTLAAGLAKELNSPLKVFSADHYLDIQRVRRAGSWETPAGIAWDDLRAALEQIATTLAECECLPPSLVVGGFSRGPLELVPPGQGGKLLGPAPVAVIIEGFLIYSDKQLCDMLGLALWIETDCEICARRRYNREGRRGQFEQYIQAFRQDVWHHYERYRGEQLANVPKVMSLDGALEPQNLIAQAVEHCRITVECGSKSNSALEPNLMVPSQKAVVQVLRPVILIGIGGSSASGKSTLARGLAKDLGSPLKVFSADHYLDSSRVRRVGSWETPAGIAWDDLRTALQETVTTLAQCECLPPSLIVGGFSRGHLDLVPPGQGGKSLGFEPIAVIVEGFLLYSDGQLCDMLDLTLWIETDSEICARRRYNREGQRGEFTKYLEAFRHEVWAKYEHYRGEQLANVPQVLRLDGALEPQSLISEAVGACKKALESAKALESVKMESYPVDFVSGLKALANAVRMWTRHQTEQHGEQADNCMVAVVAVQDRLVGQGFVASEICSQICDVALAAAAVTVAKALELQSLPEYEVDFKAASQPQPREVSGELWWRTQNLFWASARLACAKFKGDKSSIRHEQAVYDRQVRFVAGLCPLLPGSLPVPRSFAEEAERVIPATVVMLSTCMEGMRGKTSRTPYSYRVEGRCTELMAQVLGELEGPSWGDFLWAMRRFSTSGQFRDRQVPVLSCSRCLDLNSPVSFENPRSKRRRALLIGINYVGEKGLELSCGHSDVFKMQTYLTSSQGFKGEELRLLIDDGQHECPDRQTIEDGFRWLIAGASIGDSLFLLYSGHGSTYVDDTGADDPFFMKGSAGADEALCPTDFRTAGMIFDDEIFQLLIAPLHEGILLTCVIDCCQSGTILELPYVFKAEREPSSSAHEGSKRTAGQLLEALTPNADYDAGKMLQVIQTHPAMCVAASHWAAQLKAMNFNHHDEHLGAVLGDVAKRGKRWMSKQ